MHIDERKRSAQSVQWKHYRTGPGVWVDADPMFCLLGCDGEDLGHFFILPIPCLTRHQVSFPSAGKFLYTFTFFTFYGLIEFTLTGQYTLRVPSWNWDLLARQRWEGLGQQSPGTGFYDLSIDSTCCDQQMNFFFFKEEWKRIKNLAVTLPSCWLPTHTGWARF